MPVRFLMTAVPVLAVGLASSLTFGSAAASAEDGGIFAPNPLVPVYEGKLSLAGREVPVKLSVAAWPLPIPRDYQTWVDFIQSPESVALRYDVEPWSDRHWALLEMSNEEEVVIPSAAPQRALRSAAGRSEESRVARWGGDPSLRSG
jgi:hypothetical protein